MTTWRCKMAIGEVNMSSKRYTEEFKIEAIRQVVDRGYSIAEVADRLGTTTHSLYAWKKKYGRLIADCFVDGYNVNARLVYEGLALAYRKYSKRYVPEEDKARAAKRGMWAGEFVAPWDWRRGERLEADY